MKKQYVIFSFAIIAIIFMQTFFIKSLHNNYILTENEKIDNAIEQAIDLELYVRGVQNRDNVEFISNIMTLDEMPQKMRDSILAITPLPKNQSEYDYDIVELMDRGVIKSPEDILGQMAQDDRFEKGIPVDVSVLDSLICERIEIKHKKHIVLKDSLGNLLSSIGGGDFEYNYKSETIQIGLKGYQFLKVDVFIPLSNFIKRSIWIFALSLITISIPIISLLLLMTTIRKRTMRLEVSEQSINGTIHDLKSPLVSVRAMLNWFKLAEPDLKKKEAIIENTSAVDSLIKRVETLLDIARYNKKRVVVYKEDSSIDTVIEIINILKTELLLSYNCKDCTIEVDNKISAGNVLYIDTIHCRSILSNLIENALKYSDDVVNITITLENDSKDYLKITIVDNGFGIGQKHIKHLFKQFYRVPHEDKNIKGYGIGLSYIKALAIAHGGEIRVESSEGDGSEFVVKLNIKNI